MTYQLAGKRRNRSRSKSRKRSRQNRSKCNRKMKRSSCLRRSKGSRKCSWVKRKSSGRRKHKGYCKKGGSNQGQGTTGAKPSAKPGERRVANGPIFDLNTLISDVDDNGLDALTKYKLNNSNSKNILLQPDNAKKLLESILDRMIKENDPPFDGLEITFHVENHAGKTPQLEEFKPKLRAKINGERVEFDKLGLTENDFEVEKGTDLLLNSNTTNDNLSKVLSEVVTNLNVLQKKIPINLKMANVPMYNKELTDLATVVSEALGNALGEQSGEQSGEKSGEQSDVPFNYYIEDGTIVIDTTDNEGQLCTI